MTRTGMAAIEYARSRVGANAMPDSGLCLQFVRQCFDVGSYYYSAIDAWNGAQYRHPGDRNPPPGVPMYFTSPSVYDHVVMGGDPGANEIITTFNDDVRRYTGDAIAAIERDFDGQYLGWAEDINRVRVWYPEEELDVDEGTVVRLVTECLRNEGVSGAADGTQAWAQQYVRSIMQTEATNAIRAEGVNGAADGRQEWAQKYVREIVQQEATNALRAEGVNGAADGTQPWAQTYVRDIVRAEIDKTFTGTRTLERAALVAVIVALVIRRR